VLLFTWQKGKATQIIKPDSIFEDEKSIFFH